MEAAMSSPEAAKTISMGTDKRTNELLGAPVADRHVEGGAPRVAAGGRVSPGAPRVGVGVDVGVDGPDPLDLSAELRRWFRG
jgi:hypothetical protein